MSENSSSRAHPSERKTQRRSHVSAEAIALPRVERILRRYASLVEPDARRRQPTHWHAVSSAGDRVREPGIVRGQLRPPDPAGRIALRRRAQGWTRFALDERYRVTERSAERVTARELQRPLVFRSRGSQLSIPATQLAANEVRLGRWTHRNGGAEVPLGPVVIAHRNAELRALHEPCWRGEA